jgi:hypothetical protein
MVVVYVMVLEQTSGSNHDGISTSWLWKIHHKNQQLTNLSTYKPSEITTQKLKQIKNINRRGNHPYKNISRELAEVIGRVSQLQQKIAEVLTEVGGNVSRSTQKYLRKLAEVIGGVSEIALF